MSLNREAVAEATKSLAIREIYFRDEKIELDPEVTPPFWPPSPSNQFKMVTRVLKDFELTGEVELPDASTEKRSTRCLEIEFQGSVRCLGESEDRPLLFMEVSIGLMYEVLRECSEDGINEFVRMNVPFHAIPYWRERVHAVCSSRRFPSITVPMYTQAISRNEPKVQASSEEEGAD